MPKMAQGDKVRRSELPSTLKRSGSKAQRTYAKTHDAAVEQYGEGERAHRTALASLKHTHERRGDRWVPKEQPGASDPRSKKTTAQKRRGEGETFGGVDVEGNTKAELYERAKRLGVDGRSRMSKRWWRRAPIASARAPASRLSKAAQAIRPRYTEPLAPPPKLVSYGNHA